MKAIVYYNYGSPDVLQREEIEKPAAGDNEVLIKVRAASVNPYDWHFMRGTPYIVRIPAGLRKPKNTRLGVDVTGQVEALGRNVTQFKPGDEVFGMCQGAFAEYACASESAVAMKPDNVTFELAAAVPIAGFTALQGLRDKGKIQPGQNSGRRGYVRCADCQIVWRGCDRRMQHAECGHGAIHRRRSGY
jgi:NADPH:quinone reductase-like Zn-dependent oxidoreductase